MFPGLCQGLQPAVLPKGASIQLDGNFLCLPPALPEAGKKALPTFPPKTASSTSHQQMYEVCPADAHMEF